MKRIIGDKIKIQENTGSDSVYMEHRVCKELLHEKEHKQGRWGPDGTPTGRNFIQLTERSHFFFPIQSWIMRRTGWCSNNINLATKICKVGKGKQLRDCCHPPSGRY